ncbi:uncharacterized protein LOC117529669 [Thalassophryne amazonica]|uniref:uncharacterized protein LOC117529669 n=1 Tax=Thalassophryne amazonica TaxID=390379 RepID=UPI001471A235|nr:uncharacterized protein LOC117529669 [Thalassophryne amazonica]
MITQSTSGEDAGSNTSRALSMALVAASVAPMDAPLAKKRRAKKMLFCLNVQEQQLKCDLIHENACLWDIKKSDNEKPTPITHTRLNKKKGRDGAPKLTEREQWVKASFAFLKTVVHHRAEPVYCVKETITAHTGDLEAAKAACADIVGASDSTLFPIPCSTLPRDKRGQEDDQLLHSMQKRVYESGEVLKGFVQPQPITATALFANYVRDSLVSMSKSKFRKVCSQINTILSDLMDKDSEQELPQFTTVPVPVAVRPVSAPAAYTPTGNYQPLLHMWRYQAPSTSSVLGSHPAGYVDLYMQHQQQHVQQMGFGLRMESHSKDPPLYLLL